MPPERLPGFVRYRTCLFPRRSRIHETRMIAPRWKPRPLPRLQDCASYSVDAEVSMFQFGGLLMSVTIVLCKQYPFVPIAIGKERRFECPPMTEALMSSDL